MLSYLRFLSEELRARRRTLGLGQSAKALIICDMATQHAATKFEETKKNWESQNNAASWRI